MNYRSEKKIWGQNVPVDRREVVTSFPVQCWISRASLTFLIDISSLARCGPSCGLTRLLFSFIAFCRYKNTFKFIDLIESPGIAHVINTASYSEIGSHTLLAAVLGVWPIASVTMVTVCLAGVVIWILVSFDCLVIQVTLNCSVLNFHSLKEGTTSQPTLMKITMKFSLSRLHTAGCSCLFSSFCHCRIIMRRKSFGNTDLSLSCDRQKSNALMPYIIQRTPYVRACVYPLSIV